LAFDAAAIIAILALSALSAVLAFRLWNARKAAATGRVEVASLTRELDESRARIDALLARGDGVLAFDAGRIVRFVSEPAATLLGLRPDTAVGLSDIAVLRDHEIHEGIVQLQRGDAPPDSTWNFERGGRMIELRLVPVVGNGEWATVALLRDVTEIRRLETVRRDFVSNFSHEFRTPLASIKAVLETLAGGGLEDDEFARDFVERAEAETDRLTQLVEELAELGRIESGQVPFRFGPVDPRELVNEAVARLAPQARRAGITLRVETGSPVPPINADRERLERAVLNLVHNALKFTPEGGTISVRALSSGSGVDLVVQDTGSGIPASELARIFERFYKADRSRGGQGTGLGLAIVKHTVEEHGGSVSARSSLGLGSTFTVHLPGTSKASG